MHFKEIHDQEALTEHLSKHRSLKRTVLQGLNLLDFEPEILQSETAGAVFLGCTLSDQTTVKLLANGATLFPELEGYPFEPYRPRLYTRDDLFKDFDPARACSYCGTPDGKIYDHWSKTGRANPVSLTDALARRLHDMSITDALQEFVSRYDKRKMVAIMGGHSMKRNEPAYRHVVEIARKLTSQGYLMISGGGPGAMEATHLGALFADEDQALLDKAIAILSTAPLYKDKEWLTTAYDVIELLGGREGGESLGIPTWLYGHEPPTPFASSIAKYFSNSVREEGLITLAVGGIVFAPGSAGTIQEIFQDSAQNHYVTTGDISPMIFLNEEYWTTVKPVYPILKKLAEPKAYGKLIAIADRPDDVVRLIRDNPPEPGGSKGFVFCEAHCAESELEV